MNHIVGSIAVVLLLAFGAYGQATAKPRRSLDSMDLLTVRPSAVQTPKRRSVPVDADVYKVLQPLIKYAAEAERQYRASMIDAVAAPADRKASVELAAKRITAIYRSMVLLQSTDGIAQEVRERLAADFSHIAETGAVTALVLAGDDASFPKEVDAQKVKFGITGPSRRLDGSAVSERELLLAAMLKRVAEDLSAFEPIQ